MKNLGNGNEIPSRDERTSMQRATLAEILHGEPGAVIKLDHYGDCLTVRYRDGSGFTSWWNERTAMWG